MIQAEIRLYGLPAFYCVDFIVLDVCELLRLILTGDCVVGEARIVVAVMASGQRTLPGCPIVL